MPATPQTQTLQGYLDDLRRLLHDPNDRYWSQADKVVYVNKGLQQRDLDTGANRVLLPLTLTIAQDTYSFSATGNAGVIDVLGINLLFQNLRIVMDSFSFTELNVRARQYNPPLLYAPLAWCRYGPNSVIFAPAPSLAYNTEWDCAVYSTPLSALTDADVMPYPYSDPVPYYAAYWGKMNERQYDEAESFLEGYNRALQKAVNARVGTLPSAYRGGLTWVR